MLDVTFYVRCSREQVDRMVNRLSEVAKEEFGQSGWFHIDGMNETRHGGCMADWGPGEQEAWLEKTKGMTEEQKHALGLQNLKRLINERRDKEQG